MLLAPQRLAFDAHPPLPHQQFLFSQNHFDAGPHLRVVPQFLQAPARPRLDQRVLLDHALVDSSRVARHRSCCSSPDHKRNFGVDNELCGLHAPAVHQSRFLKKRAVGLGIAPWLPRSYASVGTRPQQSFLAGAGSAYGSVLTVVGRARGSLPSHGTAVDVDGILARDSRDVGSWFIVFAVDCQHVLFQRNLRYVLQCDLDILRDVVGPDGCLRPEDQPVLEQKQLPVGVLPSHVRHLARRQHLFREREGVKAHDALIHGLALCQRCGRRRIRFPPHFLEGELRAETAAPCAQLARKVLVEHTVSLVIEPVLRGRGVDR
mmetsp:Transcript_9192/g.21746  ORF Transcript_9192/g.21746 Transcript_9192/m.21746 type:complete len:319 (+) Transcript_9192:712-1668(+)